MSGARNCSTKAKYLIRKGGAFYRPNCKGYTNSVIQAGRYTLEDAERETHPNGPDGPRDGMSYLHEDDAISDDWDSYRALAAERDNLLEALEEANTLLQSIPALKNNQRVTDAVQANRAAIAKAKGGDT